MPTIKRTDLIIPEVLVDVVAGAWPKRIALYGSDAVVESANLPTEARGGDRIKVPYFGVIGELQRVAEGEELPTVPIATDAETAEVQRAGLAIEITSWAQMAAVGDPYAELSRQLIESARQTFDSELIAAAAADGAGQITVDRSSEPISYDAIVDALMSFEDESRAVAVVVVHPKIYGDLYKLRDANGLPIFNSPRTNEPPSILGLPIVVSKRAPHDPATGTYMTLFVKRNALALWYNRIPAIETDREIKRDVDVLALNVYYVVHRYKRRANEVLPGVVRLITR